VNIKEIKEMISLMNENSLLELEVEKDGTRIRLKKSGSGVEVTTARSEEPAAVVLPVKAQAPISVAPEISKMIEIKAPMVGTFYRAPSPESPPYVEIGQTVEPGQVICIIEAMKLMNEIKSEIRGKVVEVLVDNTEPVEFGQPMLLVEPI
jgi:acetyl-CoA carboxylase biotin carboxyl carrier protein